MKINKILAAGIAATLAVTSLTAVVGAEGKEPKSFSMENTVGFIKLALKGYEGKDLGRMYYLTDDEFDGTANDGVPMKLVHVPGAMTKDNEEVVEKAAVEEAELNLEIARRNVVEFGASTGKKYSFDKITGVLSSTYGPEDTANFKKWEANDEARSGMAQAEEGDNHDWETISGEYDDALAAFKEATAGVLVTLPWTDDGNGNAWADYIDIDFRDVYGDLYASDSLNLKLVVKGVKGTRTSSSKDYEYTLKNLGNGTYRLYIYEDVAPAGGFLPEQFLEITQISVTLDYTYEWPEYNESEYNAWPTWDDGIHWGKWYQYACTCPNDPADNAGNDALLDLIYESLLGGIQDGGYLDVLKQGNVYYYGVGHSMVYSDKYIKQMYAFLERTENNADTNDIIYRNEVKPISKTGAWRSQTLRVAKNASYSWDYNQTYKEIAVEKIGTRPNAFGGLASQAADYFNKCTNGKIIFKFAEKTAATSSWVSGGIPSTEVGLKSALSGTLMALFVNYDTSTGQLQSDMGVVDSDNLTITFDISNALEDMGGWTKGNIHEIYYGLMGGIEYQDDDYISDHAAGTLDEEVALAILGDDTVEDGPWYSSDAKKHAIGYLVQEVIFETEDDADISGNVDEDADDEDEIDDTDDTDDFDDTDDADDEDDFDDADDEDDEDDFDIPGDDEDDEDDFDEPTIDEPDDEPEPEDGNNGTQIIDIDTGDDDDANPGTGAALAVIPALIAAAGIAVSKKRK